MKGYLSPLQAFSLWIAKAAEVEVLEQMIENLMEFVAKFCFVF